MHPLFQIWISVIILNIDSDYEDRTKIFKVKCVLIKKNLEFIEKNFYRKIAFDKFDKQKLQKNTIINL
jgi:hypothetical protein